MMFNEANAGSQGESRKPQQPERSIFDREVPLGTPGGTISMAVHSWLDGGTPERDARHGEWSRDVDFWKRLDADLESRRRMRTPAGLNARIMQAIPPHAPAIITPWWRREFVVTPSSAVLAVVSMMAAAAAATAMILKGR